MTFPLVSRLPPKTHVGIIGASGAGKSKFLVTLLLPWLRSRLAGVTAIDPHGSFVRDIVAYCANPKDGLVDRTIHYFNPASDACCAMNPLEIDGEINDAAAAERANLLVGVVEAMFGVDPEKTPRLSRLLFVLAFAVALRGGTLLDVLKLTTLGGSTLRDIVIAHTKNPVIRDELVDLDTLARTQPARFLELVESLRNRLVRWLADPRLARLLGQPRGFNPRSAMDRRQVVLFDLGGLDYQDASFVGCLINTMYFSAAMQRAPDVSPPHVLVVDESESIMTIVTARMGDITRKYGLYGYWCFQRLEQILRNPELVDSLISNCGAWAAFRVPNPEHAKLVAEMFALGPHLNLSEWKPGTERPVAVGQRKVIVESETDGHSRGVSETHGIARSEMVAHGTTRVRGRAESESISEATGRTLSSSETQSTGMSVGTSVGDTIGETRGTARGLSQGHVQGTTHGASSMQSSGLSTAESVSDSASLTLSPPDVNLFTPGAPALASSDLSSWYGSSPDISSMSIAAGHTSMTGASATHGTALSTGISSSDSTAQSMSESQAESRSRSTAESRTHSESAAATRGVSDSHTRGVSRATTLSEAEGWSESVAHGLTASLAHGTNQTQTTTQGRSETFVTDYQWLPQQTYSLQEQIARMQGELMSLQRQEVIIRVLGEAPLKLRTPELAPAFASDKYRNLMVPRYLARCASNNPWLIKATDADAVIAAARAEQPQAPKADPATPEAFDLIDDPASFGKRFWEGRQKPKPRKGKPTLHVVKPDGDNSDGTAR